MNYFNINFVLYLLFIFNLIFTSSNITSIDVEDILFQQQCYQNNEHEDNKVIYELVNNDTMVNTIFIQYKSVKKFVISESINYKSSLLYEDYAPSGNYYLSMDSKKNKYYIIIENSINSHTVCFYAFPDKTNIFVTDNNNTNIKFASYELISSSNISYYIDNNNFSQNKIFYCLRFNELYLDKIQKPKIELDIHFNDTGRSKEIIEINEWYLQNNYYYAPFFIPKNYTEKFTEIFIYLNIIFKTENNNDTLFNFDLELIDSEEINCEFNINITANNNISTISPKIYYINIQKNIFEFERNILFLKNDFNNTIIKPFLSPNYNISNENSVLIDKNFMDISKSLLNSDKYNLSNFALFLIILDEECETITENDMISMSFKFFGGYGNLIHYQENITPTKLFNEKNKIIIKMEHCRNQYFINYFNSLNSSDDRIIDFESSIGEMHLHNSKQVEGLSIDDYFNQINNIYLNENFENRILSGKYNIFSLSCSSSGPVFGYIYGHKKNPNIHTINFLNQKSLLYIEYNKAYSFSFSNEEKVQEFDFRIKILGINANESCRIDVIYGNQTLLLQNENENDSKIFKHYKNSNAILYMILSSVNSTESKGIILEVFKSIDIPLEDIMYIEKEVNTSKLEINKTALFVYDKNEVNAAGCKIELYNNNLQYKKINICVHRGKGNYPFIIKPICTEEQEKITIEPNKTLSLYYINPYLNQNNVNESYSDYISVSSDSLILLTYKYERVVDLEENKYIDLNHKGKKVYGLSKKRNQKKSIYYQINMCGNLETNSNLFYSFNNSQEIPLKNDIYQEFPLDAINQFIIEFNSENGDKEGKFKYFYGPSNLIKNITNFSKDISLSKNISDNKLLISFESPFTELIKITIIIIPNCTEKYNDICSLYQFCEKYSKNKDNNTIIIEETIRMRDIMENKIEIAVDENLMNDFLNKTIDIYVISKSIGSNLELVYNVKSLIFDWEHLNEVKNEQNNENKNYICINCGLPPGNNEENKDIQNNQQNNEENKDIQNNQQNNEENKEHNVDNNDNRKDNEENKEHNVDNNDNRKDNEENKDNENNQNNQDNQNNQNNQQNNEENKDNNRPDNVQDNKKDNNQDNKKDIKINDEFQFLYFKNQIVNNPNNYKNEKKMNDLFDKHNNKMKEIKNIQKNERMRKFKILLYILLFILIIVFVYYYLNKNNNYNNNDSSYNKVSKNSYYD